MTTPIKTKTSHTASAEPTTLDLIEGEMAVNTADRKIFIRDDVNTIVTVYDGTTTDSAITTIEGDITTLETNLATHTHVADDVTNLTTTIQGVVDSTGNTNTGTKAYRYWRMTVDSVAATGFHPSEIVLEKGGVQVQGDANMSMSAGSIGGALVNIQDELYTGTGAYWATGTAQTITWDFTNPVALNGTRFAYVDTDVLTGFTIHASEDNSNWDLICTHTDVANPGTATAGDLYLFTNGILPSGALTAASGGASTSMVDYIQSVDPDQNGAPGTDNGFYVIPLDGAGNGGTSSSPVATLAAALTLLHQYPSSGSTDLGYWGVWIDGNYWGPTETAVPDDNYSIVGIDYPVLLSYCDFSAGFTLYVENATVIITDNIGIDGNTTIQAGPGGTIVFGSERGEIYGFPGDEIIAPTNSTNTWNHLGGVSADTDITDCVNFEAWGSGKIFVGEYAPAVGYVKARNGGQVIFDNQVDLFGDESSSSVVVTQGGRVSIYSDCFCHDSPVFDVSGGGRVDVQGAIDFDAGENTSLLGEYNLNVSSGGVITGQSATGQAYANGMKNVTGGAFTTDGNAIFAP